MKKFLSLVLALVMTMSLVTISAGAKDFDDNGDIDYKEAVDVISALGIVDGYSDGSFRPDGSLTRGAAAKIICNLILGPTTASALSATTAPFKDVPTTNVFAGYITYCAQRGIISGYGDGTFRPTGTLTGNAFMKMLLGALGYDSSVEGYTGSNWQVSVIKQASGIGLDDGNDDFVGSKAVTRQEAALYACNMLQATMVEYDQKSTIVVGDVQVNTSSTRSDVANATRTDGNIDNDNKMQFAEKYFTDLNRVDGSDDFGRPSNVWEYKNDEIGTYANTDDLVETYTAKVTSADVYDAVGKSVYDSLKDGKSDLTTYVDGVKTAVAKGSVDSYVEKNDTNTVNGSGNGMLTEVYLDDDNNVTIVSINTYVFQAVADYSSSKDSVSLTTAGDTDITLDNNTLDGDDFDIKNIKADDYILVNAAKLSNGRYDVKNIAVAEVVTGAVNSYKLDDSVTIGSTTYKYALKTLKSTDSASDTVKGTQYTVGQDAAVVLDQYGYIIAVDAAVVSSNYVYVSEFAQPSGLSSGKVVASAFFTDGTTKDITVKEAYIGSGMTSSKNVILGGSTAPYTKNAGWYTYSVNSSDEYSLYKYESKYTPASYSFSGNNTVVTENNKVSFLNGQSVYANDSTIVIVNDNDDEVTVYTGVKNLPDIKLTNASSSASVKVLARSNHYAYYVYIDVNGSASISGGEDTKLVYFVEYDGQHRGTDNEIYYTYTTLDGTAEKDVVADSKVAGSSNIYAAYYKTRTNGDGQLTNVTAVPARDGKYFSSGFTSGKENICTAPITYSDGALTLGGTGYTMADNYTITLVTVGEDVDGNGKTAADLNKDKKADYEVSTVTAKELADTLKGYAISYTFQGKTTDTNGSVIEELYVTVKEATATTTPGGGSGVIGTNDSGDEAKWVDGKVQLFYYGSPMTTDEIRTAIGNLFGYAVTNYNGVLGSATLSTGDVVSVNTTQHRQFAVKVEGTTVDFVTATDVASLGTDKTDKVPNGKYLEEATKVATSGNEITVSGVWTPTAISKDINLIPAYTVTYSGVTSVNYDNNGTPTTVGASGSYVQKGLKVTVTSSMTTNDKFQQFLIDDQPYGDVYAVKDSKANAIVGYEVTKNVKFGEKEVFLAKLVQSIANAPSDMTITWKVNGVATNAAEVYVDSSDVITAEVNIGSTGFNFTTSGAKLTANKATSTTDTTATFTYTNEFVNTAPSNGVLTFDTNKDVKNTTITVKFTSISTANAELSVAYTAGT